ncbi:MAG TPA: DUF4037 domain-containing protein [Bacillota bacterium]|nr:DUF4037 domain-containing protein [Bacillota bacterium]
MIDNISVMSGVESIGISGGKTPFPRTGEGDIDVFIYGEIIPTIEKRQALTQRLEALFKNFKINIFNGGHWGCGDFLRINGIDTWLMYFTVDETIREVESILKGAFPDKIDNDYYPIGRLAMLKDINVFVDKNGFLGSLKQKLRVYPESLAEILVEYHLNRLGDEEDLVRAVTRKDILFYHFALDLALDHFLQALFALNRAYFPSRKRTMEFIGGFKIQPENCGQRLLDIIKLGAHSEEVSQSFVLWCDLVQELRKIASQVKPRFDE